MSLPAILWAMYEAPARTNPTEKCVLMVLAEHADPSGANAFPSWERIAKTVGVSTRTIGSTISSLHAKGLIRRGDQRIAEAAVRGRGKSRAYAPTVWDLVMDGSHAAATQARLPPAVDEEPELTFFNGLGGFSTDGSEYVLHLDKGQNTPTPWVNVIANPEFVNPLRADFKIKNKSVLHKTGFKVFDYSKAGVYGSENWKQLATFDTAIAKRFDDAVSRNENRTR